MADDFTEADLNAALGTTVKTTHNRPDEGVWEGEITGPVRMMKPNPTYANDDDYATLVFPIRNVNNPDSNDAAVFINLFADKDPATNDWIRDDDGNVITRGLENASTRTKWGRLLSAAFPKEKDRVGKQANDLIGQRIAVEVKWERKKNNPLEQKAVVTPLPLSELN